MNNNILLCGNPNVGKSSIFNMLTHSHEHTGNWTGKTVSLAAKKIVGTNLNLIDLPGIYSLSSLSEEEVIAKNTLLFEDYKKIIYVVDPLNIEKNLNLLFQILEINKNVILCINMIDILENNNIHLDIERLKQELKIKIVTCSTYKKIGFKELLQAIQEDNYCLYEYNHKSETETHIENILELLPNGFKERFISLSILKRDNRLVEEVKLKYGVDLITKDINKYLLDINSENISDEISIELNNMCKEIANKVLKVKKEKRISIMDELFSNKFTTILIMSLIVFGIFFITIVLANYPSDLLGRLFTLIENHLLDLSLRLKIPYYIYEPLIMGIYRVVSFIISVMFPPLVIFFILWTYAEETGILPRIAFNFDKICKISGCHGKQCLTMCSGFGCNACAVVGARIIDSKRDRIIAILTNSFIPCNGRFPMIIAIITMFLASNSNKLLISLYLYLFVLISILMSFLVSFILSKTILKGYPGFFILELPNYKKVKLTRILKTSIVHKSLSILKKAIIVSIPSGLIIWLLTNITVSNNSLFLIISNLLDPIANLFGLDGVVFLSFFIALPANEIVLPIITMGYLGTNNVSLISDYTSIKNILVLNGWTIKIAISTILFSLMHFPCGTTLSTIKSEIGLKWAIYAFFIPLITGLSLLFVLNLIF